MSRRRLSLVGTLGLALGYIAGATAAHTTMPAIPMDAIGAPALQPAASPTANATRPISPGLPKKHAALAAGIGSPSAGDGALARTMRVGPGPFAPGHRVAGATAQRFGEPAPSGQVAKGPARRHRAPFSLLLIVEAAAQRRRVPTYILAGLAEDESSWRTSVRGRGGEEGLFQLSRAIARWCGVSDRRDPRQSADCAAQYLADLFARFGSWELALVGFKSGPDGIPEKIPAQAWTFAKRTLVKAEAYR